MIGILFVLNAEYSHVPACWKDRHFQSSLWGHLAHCPGLRPPPAMTTRITPCPSNTTNAGGMSHPDFKFSCASCYSSPIFLCWLMPSPWHPLQSACLPSSSIHLKKVLQPQTLPPSILFVPSCLHSTAPAACRRPGWQLWHCGSIRGYSPPATPCRQRP